MTTVLAAAQAAQAARNVALSKVAEALVADQARISDAQQAYEGGLAAEMGKWPSWVRFAETVGIKAADLNYSASDKAEADAFKAALDTIMDMVLEGPHDAWTSTNLSGTREQEKLHRKAGRTPEADACKREAQSAATRRTELGNVLRYGASVGRYVLDRMAQERELAGVHKATVWASIFSGCNRKCADIREAGGVITSGDLHSVAASVLDGSAAPERTDDEKRSAAAAALNAAVLKASKLGLLDVAEVNAIRRILDKNPQTQERATAAEAAVRTVTRRSEPAPTSAPKAGKPAKGKAATTSAPKAGKPAAKPAKGKAAAEPKVEPKSPADTAKIAADVI